MTPAEVADRLDPLFPALGEGDRRLALAIYRELACGAPVSLPAESRQRMRDWPGVYYDGEQRVIGFWGLSLAKTRHRLRLRALDLFAWCAWDTLFLPAVLGTTIEVESDAVRLTVSPRKVESADPPELFVSFVLPDAKAVRADVITSFCHHVRFFASENADKPPGALLLSLPEAFEVGRLLNLRRYGAALTPAG